MKEKFKIKTVKIFLCFLTLMCIMTFVSRMYYTGKLPKVSTVSIKTQGLNHTVECRGTLDSVKKTPVFVQEGLRISDLCVKKGDTVTKGDVIMQADQQYLSEKIASLEKELEDETRNLSDAYNADKKTPVFTEPGLRVSEVCVKQGDHIDKGKLLVRLDVDYLNNYIADLRDELNADYAARDGYYDQEDSRSADMISNTISQKERTLQRYNDVAANNGCIYSNCAGTVTDIYTKEGAVTDDSAAVCISDSAQLKHSAVDMQQRLDKLRTVADSEGKIKSDYSGVVTDVSLKVGDITTETAAFIVSDLSSGMIFSSLIDQEDTKYIAIGSTVSLSFRSGMIHIDECQVKSIFKDDTDGSYRVEIPLVNDELKTGEIGEMSSTVLSENKYDCLPVSSVNKKSEKTGYIYVLDQTEGFLGPEYSVRSVEVNIADKNDTYYGLSELGLGADTKVVISPSKELYDGQNVRLA